MSIVNIDDVQYIPSNEPIQTQKSDDGIVINQPLLNYAPNATQASENSAQHLMMSSSNCNNNKITPVALVRDPSNGYESSSGDIYNIHEYRIWSYFNLLFCFFCIGLYTVITSYEIRKRKRHGNYLDAQRSSRMVAVMNIVGTLSGILIFILGGLRLFGYIIPNGPLDRRLPEATDT